MMIELGPFLCACFLFYGAYRFYKHLASFLLLSSFYLAQLGSVFSCLYLETSTYISELARYSYATGATARLVFYNVVFFVVAFGLTVHLVERSDKSLSQWGRRTSRLVNIGATVFAIVLVFGLARFGLPVMMRLTRFDYWYYHPYPVFRTILGQAYVVCFALGMNYVRGFRKSSRRTSGLLFLLVLLIMVVYAIKFSGLIQSMFWFSVTALVDVACKGRRFRLSRMMVVSTSVIVLLTITVSYHYLAIHKRDDLPEAIAERLALQGHVWWAVDESIFVHNTYDRQQAIVEIERLVLWRGDSPVGMRLLMSRYAPFDTVTRYFEKGIEFTMGYPAIGLYAFGPAGLVLSQVFSGLVTATAACVLFRSLRRGRIVASMMVCKVFIDVYGGLVTGNLWLVWNGKILLYMMVGLLSEVIAGLNSRRHQIALGKRSPDM